MNAEFNWWLLIVGLVVGAGLVWFVVLETRRREVDIDTAERQREAAWLSNAVARDGYRVSPEVVERLLVLHQRYLEAPPPDPEAMSAALLADPGPVPVPPSTPVGEPPREPIRGEAIGSEAETRT